MTRRYVLVLVLAAFGFGPATALAHDDYRIIGTVLKTAPGKLDVKQTKDGKTISMKTDSATIVTRDKKKVEASELKAGTNVVVDARGDSLADLTVLEIRIVPAPTAK